MEDADVYVGLDVHKETIAVALADAGRNGEVRHYGEIANSPEAIARLVRKLAKRHQRPEFAHETGPCGYVLYRQLTDLGCTCRIVAPSRIPRLPGALTPVDCDTISQRQRGRRAMMRALTLDKRS